MYELHKGAVWAAQQLHACMYVQLMYVLHEGAVGAVQKLYVCM